MFIRTHFIGWYDGCARWVWGYLTSEQWGRLKHISHAVIIKVCVTVPPALVVLTPTPFIQEANYKSPRAYFPPSSPNYDFGTAPYERMLPAVIQRVNTPEPASLLVFVLAVGVVIRLRFTRPS